MKVLTFRIWAPYAHFRRPYTTRSPATFSIPPRPTLLGLLGAILGLDRETYSEQLSSVRVGVRIDRSVQKIRTAINLMDTKSRKLVERTQVLYELLVDPEYTIAVHSEDDNLLEELWERITHRRFYYTPYLGIATSIARLYQPEIVDTKPVDHVKTRFVAPTDAVVGATGGTRYIVERQAYHIDSERTAVRYIDIAIPLAGEMTVRRTESTVVTDGGIVLW